MISGTLFNYLFLDSDAKALVAQIPCVCYCAGWAKIHVRRPTGDTCWVTRVLNPPQSINDAFLLSDWSDEPAPNLAAMLIPRTEAASSANAESISASHPKLDRSVSAAASLSSSSAREGDIFF